MTMKSDLDEGCGRGGGGGKKNYEKFVLEGILNSGRCIFVIVYMRCGMVVSSLFNKRASHFQCIFLRKTYTELSHRFNHGRRKIGPITTDVSRRWISSRNSGKKKKSRGSYLKTAAWHSASSLHHAWHSFNVIFLTV